MMEPRSRPPTDKHGRQGQPRSRTFTGCRTCRSRHLKCDEARPTCSTCLRLNLECRGYEARLLWVSESAADGSMSFLSSQAVEGSHAPGSGSHRAASYRYPLFTEAARSAMSQELVESLGSRSTSAALQLVDATEDPGLSCHLEGPFGVFKPASSVVADAPTPPSPGPDAESIEEADLELCPAPDWATAAQHHPYDIDASSLIDPGLSIVLDHTWIEGDNSSVTLELLDNCMSAADHLHLYSPLRTPRTPLVASDDAFAQLYQSNPQCRISSRGSSRVPSPEPRWSYLPAEMPMPAINNRHGISITLPPSAAPLLRFYKERVLESAVPQMAARISPWKLLILPRALETFAELSLWNTASHTRCSIFFSLLAQAALHLGQYSGLDGSSANKWMELADTHQAQAREHLKRALKYEFEGDQQAEYTELLTGLLATGMVSVPFLGSSAMNALLADAQRLIQLRGFPIRKSFNVRMLHHMYTHIRVLAESTRQPTAMSAHAAIPDPPVAGAVIKQMGFRNFNVRKEFLGTDLDLKQEKPPDIGYTDIHLTISGSWPATLYPDIYGLPESLVTLLSQTLSLANSRPELDAMAAINPVVSLALSRHIKTLEQNIWSYTIETTTNLPAGPGRPGNLISSDTSLWEHPQTRCMIMAMHQSIIVYFYRRIYRMSAMIVQNAVCKALEYLEPCLDIFLQDQDFASSVAWCSFIVGCEAATEELQEKAAECLRKTDYVGIILSSPRKPSEVAAAVWERRRQTGDWTFSWPELLMPGAPNPG